MLGKLAPGDVVTVTRIDRLARSTFDLFGIVKPNFRGFDLNSIEYQWLARHLAF